MISKAEYRERIWSQIAEKHPEFTHQSDPFDDPWMVENLVLGDYIGFKPFEDARVMDVGANVGIWSSFCALNGAEVTAYEADPLTFEVMCSSFKKASLSVDAINAAIWTYTGKCPFHGGGENVTNGAYRNGAVLIVGGGIEGTGDMTEGNFRGNISEIRPEMQVVPCVSFADAIGDKNWDCIKMDIEGAEFQLLLSVPSEVLMKISYLHVELHNGWADETLYRKFIERLGSIFEIRGLIDQHPESEWKGRFHWVQLVRKS